MKIKGTTVFFCLGIVHFRCLSVAHISEDQDHNKHRDYYRGNSSKVSWPMNYELTYLTKSLPRLGHSKRLQRTLE